MDNTSFSNELFCGVGRSGVDVTVNLCTGTGTNTLSSDSVIENSSSTGAVSQQQRLSTTTGAAADPTTQTPLSDEPKKRRHGTSSNEEDNVLSSIGKECQRISMEHIKTSPSVDEDNDISVASSSSSSAPVYCEYSGIRQKAPHLDIIKRQGSQSSTKTCEVDLGEEERDTFSPVSSNSPSDEPIHPASEGILVAVEATPVLPITDEDSIELAACIDSRIGINNKICDDKQHPVHVNKVKSTPALPPLPFSSTKEEKQRQNEEIVIMETSSISSETGSWESIFPHHSPALSSTKLATCCTEFLQNEHKEQLEPLTQQHQQIIKPHQQRERTSSSSSHAASGTTACFIDASSLRDEDEVLSFPTSLDGPQSVEGVSCNVGAQQQAEHQEVMECTPAAVQLETFHKTFKMCKNKATKNIVLPPATVTAAATEPTASYGDSSNSSSCSSDSPHKEPNNLSDEEKLWKRENLKKQNNYDDKDHHSVIEHNITISESSRLTDDVDPPAINDNSISGGCTGELDSSDSSEVVKMRHRCEKEKGKQGSFTFHSNNNTNQHHHQHQQFSGHSISSKMPFANTSDISYTTDYSSSSPAPSLVWSDHERSSRPSALDDFENVSSSHKLCLLPPDTPHNSIVNIEPPSTSSSIHRDYTSSSQQRDSGAYCSDATDSPIMMPRTPKRTKCDEANPIVSGGASIKDFSVKQCESPPIQRKTDTCPIVSGGFMSLDFEPSPRSDDDEFRIKPKPRKAISTTVTSWIVDMSDCKVERNRSTSSSSSFENTTQKVIERSGSGTYQKNGMGFYVALNDSNTTSYPSPTLISNNRNKILSRSLHEKKSTGFYVDLSENEGSHHSTPPQAPESVSPLINNNGNIDKKNIFSMFIDFADKKSSNSIKKEPLVSRLCGSPFTQKKNDDVMKASSSSTETLMSRSSNFQKNSFEIAVEEGTSAKANPVLDPVITVAAIRRISQQRNLAAESKRHSWSNNNSANAHVDENESSDCKRSTSFSADKGLMNIIDKIPLISKTSSMSIDSSLSPFEDFTCSKSELSTYSNNSTSSTSKGECNIPDVALAANGGSSQIPVATTKLKKRRKDVQINETFDKSSVGSLTDGVLSKDLSPESTTDDTDDLTFQQDEDLAGKILLHDDINGGQLLSPMQIQQQSSTRSLIMETIIETKETASPKKVPSISTHTMESLHATIEKQKQLLETVTEHAESNNIISSTAMFVKLSDMDKPVTGKYELHSPDAFMSKSVGNHRQINRLFRDESRARPHSWTMTRSTGNSFLNITNSVDNLRSLSRLFPNFSKEFSNSLPNDMILDNNCQIGSIDYVQSDVSADSSLASSFSRSGMDESSLSCRQPRRLGEDLLKMFLQEIATDMMVEVNGRRIKAHKCILRSRCQYFAAVLAGSWAQSSGNVVSLPGYSYSAVHFALCHIYSGASHPPDGISLMELAALADLLGLEGLKEVTAHALKTNYCHNFHKPCSGCIDGILLVLPVALNHALDDLYRKCLRWTCRHYLKVWPTRQFAQMPSDILARCRQQIVAYLTSETVLDTVLDCDNLLAQLAPFRWGGVGENLVRDIMDAAYGYIADHFASLVASDSFLSLGHDKSCHIGRLQGVLLRTASSLTPDQACRSYQRVTRLNTVLQAKVIKMPTNLGELAKELQGLQDEDFDWDPEYIRLVSAIMSAVEQCLTRQCSRAMRVAAWQRLDLDLRKKVQTLARLTEPIDMRRNNKTVPKAFSFGGNTRNQDLYQVKLAIQAHSKRALTQDTHLYKASTHTQTQATLQENNIETIEKGVQAYPELKEGHNKVLKSNSRAYVPQSINKPSNVVTQLTTAKANSITAHRRTQSEVPISMPLHRAKQLQNKVMTVTAPATTIMKSASGGAQNRLLDVRSRYLEPRKPRAVENGFTSGPVRSQTSSNIPSKIKNHISSSDSSRNSSPAARRNAVKNERKIGTKSVNMSLDNIASPSRHVPNVKSGEKDQYSDICIGSLADSMKSSGVTNKTVSQDSLNGSGPKFLKCTAMNNKNLLVQQQQQQNNKINQNIQRATKSSFITSNVNRLAMNYRQNITSAGSSPSSATTKSVSRLSSISSTNSPRDVFKNRSISVPGGNDNFVNGQPTPNTVRKSFLSAKSREILARRAEKIKLQTAATGSADEKSFSTISSVSRTSSVNRSSTSNIPTRRPNSLQLKKTSNTFNKVSPQIQVSNSNHRINYVQTKTKETHKSLVASNEGGSEKWTNNKFELHIESPSLTNQERIESKLERSSTFCKESSDLDMNELQIIE